MTQIALPDSPDPDVSFGVEMEHLTFHAIASGRVDADAAARALLATIVRIDQILRARSAGPSVLADGLRRVADQLDSGALDRAVARATHAMSGGRA